MLIINLVGRAVLRARVRLVHTRRVGLFLIAALWCARVADAQIPGRSLHIALEPAIDVPRVAPTGDSFPLEWISHVAVLRSGGAAIVDNRQHRLSLFDRDGTLKASTALSSDSDRSPVGASALAVGPADEMFVYDTQSGMLHTFQLDGARIRRSRSTQLFASGSSLCTIGSTLFLLAYRDGNLVHQFNLEGRLLRSFAPAPGATEAERVASTIGGSRINCDAPSGTIVIAFNASPAVRAFGVAGTPKWEYVIDGFRRVVVRPLPDGSIRVTKPGNQADVTQSVFFVGRDALAVQVARGGRPDTASGRAWQLETVVLRAVDGVLMGSQFELGPLLAVGENKVAAIDHRARLLVHIYALSMTR